MHKPITPTELKNYLLQTNQIEAYNRYCEYEVKFKAKYNDDELKKAFELFTSTMCQLEG